MTSRTTMPVTCFPALAILAALLTGCVTSTPEPTPSEPSQLEVEPAATLTPVESKDELYALVDLIQEYHPSGWEPNEGRPVMCTTGDGLDGARYTVLLSGEGVEDEQEQQVLLDNVTGAWTEIGFEPERVEETQASGILVTALWYLTPGQGQEGMSIRFGVGSKSLSVLGSSRCVPGDPRDYN